MKFPYGIKYILFMIVSLAFVAVDFLIRDDGISWSGIFFGLCFIVFVFSPIFEKRSKLETEAQRELVEFDEKEIRRVVPGHLEEKIDWSEIDEIAIATNDQGPIFDDVHWIIVNKDKSRRIIVSNDASGFSELLAKFQSLPSFDNRQVVNAMGCVENSRFLVWKNGT